MAAAMVPRSRSVKLRPKVLMSHLVHPDPFGGVVFFARFGRLPASF